MPASQDVLTPPFPLDLMDPETFVRDDLHQLWRRLRREAPVFLHPATAGAPPFWVLTRYDDVQAVLKDDRRFSSARGNSLDSFRKPEGDPGSGKMLALSDNPRHLALRTVLLRAFTPSVRELVIRRLQERADRLIGRWVGAGPFDFAKEVAELIPIGTIGDLLGFPPEDHQRLLELSREALSSDESGQTEEDAWTARNELLVHCMDLMEARRADPADDLVTEMVTREVDGAPLTDDEVILNIYGFILAGDHTSRLAMCAAVREFAHDPAQWRAFRETGTPHPAAVEEILRWSTPVMHVARTATTDLELGGHRIRAGDLVTVWASAANRDEAHFPDPDSFDIHRAPNRHLSFGSGPHYCFGAFLGRAEIAAVLDSLTRLATSITTSAPPRRLYSNFLHGYSSLPVSLA